MEHLHQCRSRPPLTPEGRGRGWGSISRNTFLSPNLSPPIPAVVFSSLFPTRARSRRTNGGGYRELGKSFPGGLMALATG